jgi:hypothetical protein
MPKVVALNICLAYNKCESMSLWPSLRIKKIQGTESIFEFTITMSIRTTFEFNGDTIILRNIGEHDRTLKNK